MGADFPPFAEFYRVANGREPFPWQNRLAHRVVEAGWPSQIGVPTGLGKSGCLDIALWALAAQASLPPDQRTAPTRVWYVVNRRLLVDQAFDHGEALQKMLASGEDAQGCVSDVMRRVADALRVLTPLGPREGSLQVTRLRGGADLGQRPLEPSQPALIFATVAMFASRWLFRGYGSSRSMRPVDAALAGIDNLVLLDEAHLSRPLVALADNVASCDIGDPSRVIAKARSRPVMVTLTATGEPTGDRFDLDADDHQHPVVARRVHAAKPVRLDSVAERSLAQSLVTTTLGLLDCREAASSCIVFVTSPKLAREVVARLREEPEKTAKQRRCRRPCEVLMATGRMREREAAGVRARLLAEEGTPAWRDRSRPRARDLIVVATQTLEVGADLDFDVLVTETCGTRALIQRLGRLNRLGETHDAAGAIVHAADRKEWPVYGEEPLQVWQRLNAAQLNDTIDLAPAQAAAILGPPNDEPARVGELLQAHLWEWAKTSFPPADEAPVDLFFSGFDEQMGRVSVCWRAHLPKDEVRLFPGVTESEVIEVPLTELRDALQAQHIDSVRRLADDRISLETVARTAVRPGDGIVLPTTVNLYDRDGWNPNPAPGSDDVLDVSLLRAGVLPLSRSVLANLALGAGIPKSLSVLIDPDEDGLAPEEERDLVEELLAALRAGPHHPWLGDEEWQQFLADMGTEVLRPVDDAPFLQRPARDRLHVEVRADAFDEMSFDVASSLLADHQGAVADVAEKIAGALGIDPMLRQAVKEAARLHDVGKADPRFQRWLDPRLTSLKAKSQTPRFLIERERRAAGWPKGGRHELVSLHILTQYVASLDDQPTWDPELLLHLVAAHHGQGRPLVPVADDPTPPRFTFDLNGRHVAVRDGLHWVDWSQPSRFRSLCERYGYWGLALMEAIVRQADQVVSSAGGVV